MDSICLKTMLGSLGSETFSGTEEKWHLYKSRSLSTKNARSKVSVVDSGATFGSLR